MRAVSVTQKSPSMGAFEVLTNAELLNIDYTAKHLSIKAGSSINHARVADVPE
jgi:hypothetical protein